MNISDALILAANGHKKQKRRDGSAYIYHPIMVANALKNKGYDETYQITGLLHDVLEDTDISEQEILDVSNEQVLEAVKLLTKSHDIPEEKYINDILCNPIAKAVKNEDRINNLQDALKLNSTYSIFIKKYLNETKKYFVGKFSEDLDYLYNRLDDYYNYITGLFTYSVNPSIMGSLYRTNKTLCSNETDYFNGKKWVPYQGGTEAFILDNGDDILSISLEEVEKIIFKADL